MKWRFKETEKVKGESGHCKQANWSPFQICLCAYGKCPFPLARFTGGGGSTWLFLLTKFWALELVKKTKKGAHAAFMLYECRSFPARGEKWALCLSAFLMQALPGMSIYPLPGSCFQFPPLATLAYRGFVPTVDKQNMRALDRASWLSLSGHHRLQQLFMESQDRASLSYQHSKSYTFMSAPCLKGTNKCLFLSLWLRLGFQVHEMVKIRVWPTYTCNLYLCCEQHAIELALSRNDVDSCSVPAVLPP